MNEMVSTTEPAQGHQNPIRVFLVDEELTIGAGMRMLIDSWPISKVVGEADAIPEAIARMKALKPDLIVFSHNGRSRHAGAGIRKLVKAAGQAPLVLVTSSRDPKIGGVAIRAGARWVMPTQNNASELRTAIEKAHNGETQTHNAHLQSPRGDASEVALNIRYKGLTRREHEVASLVGKGLTNRQVGLQLGIAEATVRHHIGSIFNKLGFKNRFQLIVWLLRRGLSGTTTVAVLPNTAKTTLVMTLLASIYYC